MQQSHNMWDAESGGAGRLTWSCPAVMAGSGGRYPRADQVRKTWLSWRDIGHRPTNDTAEMRSTAYIETSVVSYLTSRPSRDVVVLAHQEVTRKWWRTAGEGLQLVASELVLREAAQGDPDAARVRLGVLKDLTLLDAT